MPSARRRVLVVEDEKPLATALALKLGSAGFDVSVAEDGIRALKALDTGTFHAIVLDLVMPGMDGFAVLEALREKKSKVPVLVLSNLSQGDDRARAEELGASAYLVKSDVQISEVVRRVTGLIS